MADFASFLRNFANSGLTKEDKHKITQFVDMYICVINEMTARIQINDIGCTRPNDPICISLAKPMDAHGMFEIALLDKIDGDIVCNDELDYNDIQRFDTLEEVQAEISRLAHL